MLLFPGAASTPAAAARAGLSEGSPLSGCETARSPGRDSGVGMSSGTMKFNGYLRVRIGEAVGLQPTRWSLRHSLFKKGHQLLDPYLTVSVDQVRVGQTSTKQKTNKPTYNEEFCANVTDGGHLELAVFHETPLGYDHFVANCTLQFQELLRTAGASDTFEGWVSTWSPPLGVHSAPFSSFIFTELAWDPLSHLPRLRGSGNSLHFWTTSRWPVALVMRPWWVCEGIAVPLRSHPGYGSSWGWQLGLTGSRGKGRSPPPPRL